MTYAAKSAYGTAIKIGTGTSSETFNELMGVTNIRGPEYACEILDVTHHGSSTNYRDVVPTFLSGGTVSFDIYYDSTDTYHIQLFTDFTARSLRNFQMVHTDAGAEQEAFAAYITQLSRSAAIDGAVTMACVLSISGAITRS